MIINLLITDSKSIGHINDTVTCEQHKAHGIIYYGYEVDLVQQANYLLISPCEICNPNLGMNHNNMWTQQT